MLILSESFIFTLRASDPDADDTQDDLIFEMVTSTSDFGVTQSGYVYTNITLDYETVTSHGPFNFKYVVYFREVINCSQTKFVAIILVLTLFFMRFIVLPIFRLACNYTF